MVFLDSRPGESELLDRELFVWGFEMAHSLDQQFGLPPKTTMSQRDVPGITRSVVPLLRQAGVAALSIGCNGASAPPGLPQAFVWADKQSGESIVGMLHPGGYGGTTVADAVMVPGWNKALIMAFNGDNAGPQTVWEVIQIFQQVREEFVGASVFGR